MHKMLASLQKKIDFFQDFVQDRNTLQISTIYTPRKVGTLASKIKITNGPHNDDNETL